MLSEEILESCDDNWVNDITLHLADLHLSSKTDKTEKNTVENNDGYYKNNSNDKHKWTKQARIAKLARCTLQQQKKKTVPSDNVSQETQDELSNILKELDKRYTEARARGIAARALTLLPTEEEQHYKQNSKDREDMRRIIHMRWLHQSSPPPLSCFMLNTSSQINHMMSSKKRRFGRLKMILKQLDKHRVSSFIWNVFEPFHVSLQTV
jgi:hypothetical protein